MDKILAGQPLTVPVLLVGSLWDAEDIYGYTAVWKALKPKDTNGDMVRLSIGPWFHGQEIEDGQFAGRRQVRPGHRQMVAAACAGAGAGALSEGRCAAAGCRARHRVRDRHQ